MPALQAAYRTDPGRVRTNNEDVPLVDAERGVYGVIDGVGGQAAGEFAAAIAYNVILQRLARPLGTPANVCARPSRSRTTRSSAAPSTSRELAGMTCVVTLAIVNDGRLTIGHVGDSRLYKLGPERHAEADARSLARGRAGGCAGDQPKSTRCDIRVAMRSSATSAARCATKTKTTTSRSWRTYSSGTPQSCSARMA